MNQFLQKHQRDLIHFAKQNNLKYLALFGSHARGEETTGSDVDLLAEYSKGTSLFDVVNMEMTLEKKIGKKIDLVSKKYLNKHIKPYVEQDLTIIYEQK